MKNCKYCNEFMCGDSHTDRISLYCGKELSFDVNIDKSKTYIISINSKKPLKIYLEKE